MRRPDAAAIDRAVALLRDGATVTAAAAAIGVHPTTLRRHLHARGLAGELLGRYGRRRPRIPEAVIDQAIALLRTGADAPTVAAALGMSVTALQLRLAERGTTIAEARGARARQPLGIDRLRRLIAILVWIAATPATGSELAEAFGIGRDRIKDDIALLRAAGVEITAQRGGGYRAWLPRPDGDAGERDLWERFIRRM